MSVKIVRFMDSGRKGGLRTTDKRSSVELWSEAGKTIRVGRTGWYLVRDEGRTIRMILQNAL